MGPNSPPVVMPANAGEASIARLDKIWNQKGSLNTATLRRELQNAMQKHAPVYRNGKDLHDGKAVLQDIMRKYKDVNCVDKQNLVWNTDLIETMELENLIGQAAQGLYSGAPSRHLRDSEDLRWCGRDEGAGSRPAHGALQHGRNSDELEDAGCSRQRRHRNCRPWPLGVG